ncbi:amino acid transmembrane transporter protein [Trichomonas vaginalis G3]|uniref:amino acid transmembrane transporter protein n=1 Tax=Trichomonas vaginalis (strain ATCC PRA-98 / G3) TaxID=412133 RepID=UPI0021E5ECFF|nr:amino acid transmembrane transporter protein [Trichomonas vaginalis G3]KAI5528855.1 amino acid transmembrane transporter protein [Trichomonas vaginalis G3]
MTSDRAVSSMNLFDPLVDTSSKIPDVSQGFIPTFMTTLSVITGVEVLSIANSMIFTGFVVSMFLMFFTTALSYICTVITLNLAKRYTSESINDLATKIIGRWFGDVCSILGLCFTYSCLTSYIFLGSETVFNWLELAGLKNIQTGYKRVLIILGYSILIPVLTTIPRQTKLLGYISSFALIIQIIYFCSIIYEAIIHFPNGIDPTVETYVFNINIFNAFAIYSLLFSLPAVILPIVRSYTPVMKSRYQVIGLAVFVSYIVVAVPGAIVYLIFGAKTDQIAISSFDGKDVVMQIVRACFFIVVNASYAAISQNVIQDVTSLIYHVESPGALPGLKRLIVLLCTNIPPISIAILLPEIRPMFEIGGAFGGCLANFFIPSILAFFALPKKLSYAGAGYMFLALFGILCCAIATYEAVVDALHPGS